MDSFLYSREGVTQGDPLNMTAYGIGIIPMIKQPEVVFLDATHTWYADDACALGTLPII